MIAEWSQTKQAPKHAAWLHNGDDFRKYAAKPVAELSNGID